METMMIKGLRFVKTCSACPEQYDVFDYKNEQVGYVRLRWGNLTCEHPGCGGAIIFETCVGDGWLGCFNDESQREVCLDDIANAILRRLDKNNCAPAKQVKCIGDLYNVFGPWYYGDVYDIIKYDEENGEWHIQNAYHEPGIVTDKEFREHFERIEN